MGELSAQKLAEIIARGSTKRRPDDGAPPRFAVGDRVRTRNDHPPHHTRLRRLESGDFDGIVIAAAGLHRLDRADEISFLFDPAEMTPAAGQGTLALELRADDEQTSALVAELTDPASATELAAERSLIAALEASCNSPIGARARQSNERLTIDAYVGLPDGSEWVRDSVEGEASDSEGLGLELATRLSTAGARELLERAEQVAA